MQGRFSSTDHGLFFLLFFCLFPVLHLYFGLSSVLYFFCFLNYFVGWWVVWELKVTTLGHRNIKVLSTSLDDITWKTAASKHIASFLALYPLLFQIFLVCKNGLVPAALLEKAGSVD